MYYPKQYLFVKGASPQKGDLRIGPPGLEERPANSRDLGTIHFAVLAAASIAPLKSHHNLAG
jgi:hypothetical protein